MKFSVYGTSLILAIMFIVLGAKSATAQYGLACSEYGVMAFENYSGMCECRSGYVFQESYDSTRCVSADQVCHEKYGYGSDYDTLSDSCECSYGYTFGKDSIGRTQCISESQACENELGYHSRSTYGGGCECSYGYVIDGGECKSGDSVCQNDHGYHSTYDDLSNRCECDTDYTFDDNYQCVEKQHNVYFRLLDTNFDDSELIIKSEYDYKNYIVRYGVGCFDYAISTYEGSNLVVNLGTDYDVDTFDTIVLQNHSQTCSILSREVTWDDSFPEEVAEEEEYDYVIPTSPTRTSFSTNFLKSPGLSTTANTNPLLSNGTSNYEPPQLDTAAGASTTPDTATTTSTTTTDEINATTSPIEEAEEEPSMFKKILSFFKNLFSFNFG